MKFVKKYNNFLTENYKSDDDITKEFEDFKVSQIDIKARDMSFMYPKGTFQGDVYWEFPDGDEHVGGGSSTTSEDFNYNINTGEFVYSVNNWYPSEVYDRMVEIIKGKLEDEYKKEFNKVKFLEK